MLNKYKENFVKISYKPTTPLLLKTMYKMYCSYFPFLLLTYFKSNNAKLLCQNVIKILNEKIHKTTIFYLISVFHWSNGIGIIIWCSTSIGIRIYNQSYLWFVQLWWDSLPKFGKDSSPLVIGKMKKKISFCNHWNGLQNNF